MGTITKKFFNTVYHLTLVCIAICGILYLGDFFSKTEAEDDNKVTTEAVNNTSGSSENMISTDVDTINNSDISENAIPLETITTDSENIEVVEESQVVPLGVFDQEALQLLSLARVTNTDGYQENFNKSNGEVNVFAEEIENSFSFLTLSWYNLWGENQQSVVFNAQKISEVGDKLTFDCGIASGGEGTVKLTIFFNEESEIPEHEYYLNAEAAPIHLELCLSDRTSLKIVVDNQDSNSNEIVFYNFEISPNTEI